MGQNRSHIHLSGGDVVPPGGGLADDFSHLQFIRRLVNQSVERTHGDDPGQVKTTHLNTNAHLHTQTHSIKPILIKPKKNQTRAAPNIYFYQSINYLFGL